MRFVKRYYLPSPPDNAAHEEILAAGYGPLFRPHNHSPGFTVTKDGDLLVMMYSTYSEYDAESGLFQTRLPFDRANQSYATEWDFPEMSVNPVGVNDHGASLFTDADGTVYLFWGWPQMDSAFPFQYAASNDGGRTWGEVRFPRFTEKVGAYTAQPINSVFRGQDGTYYVACDAKGASSVLWRSMDLVNWEVPKGLTRGRHTTFAELNDGRLLGMGGKGSNIDGCMPMFISDDRGDCWVEHKSPFAPQAGGQRPCVIRLASGRLFMCGDYQSKFGERAPGEVNWGSYAAYSEDEGGTWKVKPLWGVQRKKKDPDKVLGGAATVGYSVARQSHMDGMIHVITSNVHPCVHLAFDEEWLLAPEAPAPPDAEIMPKPAPRLFTTYYPNGVLRSRANYLGMFAEGLAEGFDYKGNLVTESVFEGGRMVGSKSFKVVKEMITND
jgi:hypothetical protein